MIILAALAGLAQALDLMTFAAVSSRYGTTGEVNPIMVWAYDLAGIPAVALIKGSTVLLFFLVAYAMQGAGAPTWIVVSLFVMSMVVGALGAASNVWALTI